MHTTFARKIHAVVYRLEGLNQWPNTPGSLFIILRVAEKSAIDVFNYLLYRVQVVEI